MHVAVGSNSPIHRRVSDFCFGRKADVRLWSTDVAYWLISKVSTLQNYFCFWGNNGHSGVGHFSNNRRYRKPGPLGA